MGGEIIAERFSLLKTRGSNGLAFTHIVEDILDGRRLVVKVSDRLGILGLEYLKACNLISESGVEGLLLPLEGGLLDEGGEGEGGYYLAFPEVGEPSLENYLRMRAGITCGEVVYVLDRVLQVLDGLHRAGFLHLFLEPRNVFYLPRRAVTLKDPALRAEFFHPFLEMVASPDFSYLHPSLMDGGMPGPEADLYAAGKLAERLYLAAMDGDSSPMGEVVLRVARACMAAGEKERGVASGGEGADVRAGTIREEMARWVKGMAGMACVEGRHVKTGRDGTRTATGRGRGRKREETCEEMGGTGRDRIFSPEETGVGTRVEPSDEAGDPLGDILGSRLQLSAPGGMVDGNAGLVSGDDYFIPGFPGREDAPGLSVAMGCERSRRVRRRPFLARWGTPWRKATRVVSVLLCVTLLLSLGLSLSLAVRNRGGSPSRALGSGGTEAGGGGSLSGIREVKKGRGTEGEGIISGRGGEEAAAESASGEAGTATASGESTARRDAGTDRSTEKTDLPLGKPAENLPPWPLSP